MTPVEYFKLQAKNLFRDYKTKTSYLDEATGYSLHKYDPKYFDVDGILLDYDWNEENFSLMKAQHTIALMAGFRMWTDLSKASAIELELAKLLFDNQHKINAEEWDMYIAGVERDHKTTYDPESRLEMFKHVFVNVEEHRSMFLDYRLNVKDHI